MMVKVHCKLLKTLIHENIEDIDINQLLAGMAKITTLLDPHLTIEGHCKYFISRQTTGVKTLYRQFD